MLVLTRKPNESLTIVDNIEITVLSVKGNQVQICINEPKDVCIFSDELILLYLPRRFHIYQLPYHI